MLFKAWCEANPTQASVIDGTDEEAWNFEQWKDKHKLKDSSRRLQKPEDDATWVDAPPVSFLILSSALADFWNLKELKNVYIQGINLITSITDEINKSNVSGASSASNAMLHAVQELTSEIRAFCEVYMAVVSSFEAPI
jgi:hypothetical protein